MKKVAVAGAILLLLAALAAIVVGSLFWSAQRKLDERAAWVEEELRRRAFEASHREDFDWPPYREFLARLRDDSWRVRSRFPYFPSNDDVQAILAWSAQGCPMTDLRPMDDVGFDNRHWPYIFGLPEIEDVPRFIRGAPMAQDFYQGAGFGSSLFRISAERRMYCGWRHLLARTLLTPELLAACADVVDRLEAARPSLKDEIEVEHLLRCREILRIYRTGEDPLGRLENQKPGFRSLYSRTFLFSRVLARLDDQRIDALHRASLPPDELWEWIVTTPLSTLDRAVLHFEALSTLRRRLFRTALAVAQYAAATKTLPERLEELVPKYLPSIPVCPLTLSPLSYTAGTVSAPVEDPLAAWTVRDPHN